MSKMCKLSPEGSYFCSIDISVTYNSSKWYHTFSLHIGVRKISQYEDGDAPKKDG